MRTRSRPARMAQARWLVLLVAALVLIAGCGSSQPAQPAAKPAAPAAGAPAAPAPAAPAAKTPVKDGTLIIANSAELTTLDPQATTALQTQRLRTQIYDALVDVDWDAKTVIPSLAESWDVSADGLKYTFKLRGDVKFHSGKALDSGDVKYTFERWKKPELKSPNAWLIREIKSIDAPDPRTVVLNLSKPNPDLIYNLVRSDASILNAKFTEEAGKDYGTKKVDGTGPFKLKEWVPRQKVVFERFDDYKWAPKNYTNKGPAHIKEIVWKSLPEEATRLLELDTAAVHIVQPRISFHEVDRLIKAKKHDIVEYPVGSTVNIGFNLLMPPMDDINVRKAFSMAVNTEEINKKVMFGHAYDAHSLVAPHIDGYCAECKDLKPKYDLAGAKKVLDDAGWKPGPDGIRVKDGKRLSFPAHVYSTLAPYPESYQVIQAMAKEAGIHIDLQLMESAKVFALYGKGQNGMWSSSVQHDTAYQAAFMSLHSKSAPGTNRYNLKDKAIDELLDKAATEPDAKKRAGLYVEAQKLALKQYAYVPWFQDKGLVAVNKKVQGFKAYAFSNSVFHKMTDVWVEK